MIVRSLVVLTIITIVAAYVAVLTPQLAQFVHLMATSGTWVAALPACLGVSAVLMATVYIKGE